MVDMRLSEYRLFLNLVALSSQSDTRGFPGVDYCISPGLEKTIFSMKKWFVVCINETTKNPLCFL